MGYYANKHGLLLVAHLVRSAGYYSYPWTIERGITVCRIEIEIFSTYIQKYGNIAKNKSDVEQVTDFTFIFKFDYKFLAGTVIPLSIVHG